MRNKHQKRVFWPPSHTKNISLAISSHKYKKIIIYILIAILFFAHMMVNVAASLDFFIYIYMSVTFISGLLSYYN